MPDRKLALRSGLSRRAMVGGLLGTAGLLASPAAHAGWWLRVSNAIMVATAQNLTPGPNYNGTAGSGYSAAQTQYLNDLDSSGNALTPANDYSNMVRGTPIQYYARPESGFMGRTWASGSRAIGQIGRITPSLHWLAPVVTDNLFSSDFTIMWASFAAASDGILGGVDHFNVYCEGNVFVVPGSAMGALAIPTWGGGTKYFPGYLAILLASAFASFPDGSGVDLYIEAVPSLQGQGVNNRVIGPMRLYHKASFDQTLYVDPQASSDVGTTFASFAGALSYIANNSNYKAPYTTGQAAAYTPGSTVPTKTGHIKILYVNDTPGGGEDLTVGYSNWYRNTYNLRGRIVVDANGHNVVHRCPENTFSDVKYGINNLTLVGIKIDTKNLSTLNKIANPPDSPKNLVIFDLCEWLTSDPNGSQAVPPAGTEQFTRRQATGHIFDGQAVGLTRCYIHDCAMNDIRVPVAIGNIAKDLCYDLFDICYGHPTTIVGNEFSGISGQPMILPQRAFDIAYTGPGTGTFSLAGNGPGGAWTLTLEVNSGSGPVAVATFSASTQDTGAAAVSGTTYTGIFSMQEASDAINAFGATAAGAGWSASPADGTGARYRFTQANPKNLNGQPPSVAVSHLTLDQALATAIDVHCDFGQCANGISQTVAAENVLVGGNTGTQCVIQPISPLIQSVGAATYNWHNVNNAIQLDMDYAESGTEFTQINGAHYHFIIAHCSWPSSGIMIRTDYLNGEPTALDVTSRIYGSFFDQYWPTTGSGGYGQAGVIKAQIKNNVINNLYTGYSAITDSNFIGNKYLGSAATNNQGRLPYADSADFTALADGAFAKNTAVKSHFGVADHVPSKTAGNNLRQAANLCQPHVPVDNYGLTRAGNDMVGAVSLAV